ncbi:MAG: hypothetical protein HYY84_07020 [Deltaproteobacteria bacterium]|nr:hypothetical protein [Deltaproteobacteria bacterium]
MRISLPIVNRYRPVLNSCSMSRWPFHRVAVLSAPLFIACIPTAEHDTRGTILVGTTPPPAPPARFRGTRADYAAAMNAVEEWVVAPKTELQIAASFTRASAAGEVALLIRDVTEMIAGDASAATGEPVFSDVVTVAPGSRSFAGTLPSTWARPCRRYRLSVFSDRFELATGHLKTKPCRRAIDELRGGILVTMRSADRAFMAPPALAQFPLSLADYARMLGARSEHLVEGDKPVLLGIRAALPRPAGEKRLTVVVSDETDADFDAARLDVGTDPTWDTVAAEWPVAVKSGWLKPGHRYRLALWPASKTPVGGVSKTNNRPLAVGRFRFFHRE